MTAALHLPRPKLPRGSLVVVQTLEGDNNHPYPYGVYPVTKHGIIHTRGPPTMPVLPDHLRDRIELAISTAQYAGLIRDGPHLFHWTLFTD